MVESLILEAPGENNWKETENRERDTEQEATDPVFPEGRRPRLAARQDKARVIRIFGAYLLPSSNGI